MIISSSWGVIVAKHQQTKQVADALCAIAVEYFIPKIETLRIIQGRHVRELRPMLGDYILTSIDAAWESLCDIRGVAGMLINSDGYPAQVMPGELKRMHDMCDDAGVYHSEIIWSGFQYGEKVTPKEGPFFGFTGSFDCHNKRGDQIASFTLFGREQSVTFKPGVLLAV